MKTDINSRLWPRVACACGALILAGCVFPHEGGLADGGANDNDNSRSYHGLTIVGERTPSYNDEFDAYMGPVDLTELAVTAFSQCHDEMVGNAPADSPLAACKPVVLDPGHDDVGKMPFDCLQSYCYGVLYTCTGYKALELADAVEPVIIESRTFDYFSGANQDVFAVILKPKPAENRHSLTTFRIPPLSAESKTLAYLAALGSFKAAGFMLGGAYDRGLKSMVENGGDTCMDYYADWSQNTTSHTTVLDHYVMSLTESTAKLAETIKLLTDNQTRVASSHLSRIADDIDSQEAVWTAKVNSYSAAIRTIVGDKDERISTPGCRTELDKPGRKRAAKLLRLARAKSIYQEAPTTTEVLDDMIGYLAQDLGQGGGGTPTDADRAAFLDRHGISLNDIEIARRYLNEEKEATGVLLTGDASDTERYEIIPEATGARPGAYFVSLGNGHRATPVYSTLPSIPPEINARLSLLPPSPQRYLNVGTIQVLDYMRDTADQLLRDESFDNAPDYLSSEHEHTLMSTSALVASTVGRYRISVQARGLRPVNPGEIITDRAPAPFSGRRVVKIYGAKPDDEFLFASSEAGYRCLTIGTIDGAKCQPAEHLLEPLSNTLVDVNGGMRGTLSRHRIYQLTESSPRVFVLRKRKNARPVLLGFFDWNATTDPDEILYLPVLAESELAGKFQSLTGRGSAECSKPKVACGDLGLPRDYIPTLENEIIEAMSGGQDQLENSWAHYLRIAREAAYKADSLGEQLVQAGLDMDLRSEQAMRELERICGGVVSFAESLPAGASDSCTDVEDSCDVVQQYVDDAAELQSCVPESLGGGMERIPYSTAGSRPVCIAINNTTQAICDSDFPGTCPKLAVGLSTADECWGAAIDPTAYTPKLVEHHLNIFQSNDSGSNSPDMDPNTCYADVEALRTLVESDGDRQQKAAKILQFLNAKDWINKDTLGYKASQLGLELDVLHHYTVKFGNRVLWTTKHNLRDDCPIQYPWKKDSSNIITDCVSTDVNHSKLDASAPYGQWILGEVNYIAARKEWGERLQEMIVKLGVLTDSMGNVRQAGWWWREGDYKSEDVVSSGEMHPNLYQRAREPGFADDPVQCFIDNYTFDLLDYFGHDPHTPGCYSTGSIHRYRYEYRLDLEGKKYMNTFEDFWAIDGLARFLAGNYPQGELWLMRSSKVENLRVVADVSYGTSNLRFERRSRQTSFVEDENQGIPLPFPYEYTVTPLDFVDLLEFTCALASNSNDVVLECDSSDPNSIPITQVTSKRDLKVLNGYLRCAANDIHRVAERMIIPNLPQVLVDNFQTNGMEGLYGEFAGDNLKALLAIEGSLRSLNTAKGDISSILMNGSLELSNAELQLENISHEKAINHIRSVKVALEAAIRCIQACMSANTGSFIDKSTNVGPAIAISALSIAVAALEEGIFDLERQILDNQEDQTYNEAMLAFIAKLRELSGVFGTIKDAYSEIQASLTTLDQNQNEAAYWWAVGMGLDGDTAGRVFPVNTVMRRRKNTLRIRYQQAAKRARRLAFIARRAIEFRFGVDLSQMTEEMSLVEAPSTWADRVCDMQGFSYDRLRDAFPEDPLLDPELQDSDNYAHWYIGDYVDLLEAFVQSYNQDYPMTDERDVAVVSLRDDIMQARQQCEIPSRNLLVYSGDVGRRAVVEDPATQTTFVRGWVSGGCSENPAAIINCSNSADPAQCVGLDRCLAPVVRDDPDSAFCEEGFCFGNDYGWVMNDPSNPKMGEMPHAADRLRDQPLPLTGNQNGRTVNGENTGYYDQLVTGLTSGDYVLSWWAHEPVDVVTPVDYRVEVLTADGQTLISGTNNPYIAAPRQSWYDTSNPNNESREWLSIYLDAPQDVIVRVHPSDPGLTDDISSSAAFGDVWIWGMQLERLTCDECVAGPGRYYDTGDTNTITREMCPDLDGSVMRQRFEYKCVCVGFEGGICPEDSYGDSYRRCYWEFPFEIMLDRIERGDLIPSNNIAIGNFNYRHEALAVNVVGTGVTDCSDPTAPPNCYTNAFLPYTLEHQGWVQVKNHNRQTMEYEMPTARVEHGKGLTAEVVLTNPLTGSHSQLLTDYWKDGLRGRPLQGEYLLRIWDTGELSWSKIEDIQIVWKYRYWTQMGSSY